VSFVIVLAVLTDTFIVRIMLVPAIMALLGEWNWWPTPMHGGPGSPAHRAAPRKALDELYQEML
jgi:RND superfamily putative drug exporter